MVVGNEKDVRERGLYVEGECCSLMFIKFKLILLILFKCSNGILMYNCFLLIILGFLKEICFIFNEEI